MTDLPARIRRLARIQRWALRVALAGWLVGTVLGVVEHEWIAALASAGAAIMAAIALGASKARDVAAEVIWDPQRIAARVTTAAQMGRDEAMGNTGRPRSAEDERRKSVLFNDITYAPVEHHILLSDRRRIQEHLWAQGWRRGVRPEDVTMGAVPPRPAPGETR